MGGYANGGDAENSTSTDPQTRLGGNDGPYVLSTTEVTTIAVTISVFLLALFLIFYYRKLQARRKLDLMNKAAVLENGLRSRKNSAAPGSSGSGGGGESIELKPKDKDGAISSSSTLTGSTATAIGAGPVSGPRPLTPAPPAKDRPREVGDGGEVTAGGKQKVLMVSRDGNDPFTTPRSSSHDIAAAAAAAKVSCPPPTAVIATRMSTIVEKPPLWKYIHWKGDPRRNSKNATLLPQVEPRRRGSNGVVQGM